MDGADLYQRSGCDSIVAIGGGSPIDCAKGIGIVVSNKRHVLEFEGVDNVLIPGTPPDLYPGHCRVRCRRFTVLYHQ